MKLTIKTLDRRSIVVDFDEQRTVGDLKKFLFDSKELTIEPDLQNLIYSGKQLKDDEVLAKCSIDEKRFLVVMAMKEKKPKETPKAASSSSKNAPCKKVTSTKPPTTTTKETDGSASSAPTRIRAGSSSTITVPTPTPPVSSEDLSETTDTAELLIEQMVPLGYSEAAIRRALESSNNDSDLAVEYLINGLPGRETTPNPQFEILRQHPRFQELRQELGHNPEMMCDVLTLLDTTNPALAALIRDNQEEFLRMLHEPTPHDGPPIQLDANDRLAVERLVALGFDPECVLDAYIACDRNEEATADFLCHQFDED